MVQWTDMKEALIVRRLSKMTVQDHGWKPFAVRATVGFACYTIVTWTTDLLHINSPMLNRSTDRVFAAAGRHQLTN